MKILSILFALGLLIHSSIGFSAPERSCGDLFVTPTAFDYLLSGRVKIAPHALEIADAVQTTNAALRAGLTADDLAKWIDASILQAENNYHRTLTPGILLANLPNTEAANLVRERVVVLHFVPRHFDDFTQSIRDAGLDVETVKKELGFYQIARHYRLQYGNAELIRVTGLIIPGLRKRGYDNAALYELMMTIETGREFQRAYDRKYGFR